MGNIVYRVQARDGRGPFRPGFTAQWADGTFDRPMPWMVEFGHDLFERKGRGYLHYGCAVRRVNDIAKWFSSQEQRTLAAMGYDVVALKISSVIAESKNQLIFGRHRALNEGTTIVSWPAIASVLPIVADGLLRAGEVT